MILVDTSVWIAAFRDAESVEAVHLRELLDRDEAALATPVRLEILSGTRARDLGRLKRLFSALPSWLPGESTWERIESWIESAIEAGERFGIADLLVASIAVEHEAPLWSLDRDFRRMSKLGFVKLHQP